MTAAISGEICTARLLLKHEANGLLCNTTGQTANQIAKQCKNDELANFIERKANQNLSNSGKVKRTGRSGHRTVKNYRTQGIDLPLTIERGQ